jgi:hypothetical protein
MLLTTIIGRRGKLFENYDSGVGVEQFVHDGLGSIMGKAAFLNIYNDIDSIYSRFGLVLSAVLRNSSITIPTSLITFD